MMFFTELMSFGQRAAYAWELFLIGMGTVFAVLALLWGEVALFRRLAEKANKQERKPSCFVFHLIVRHTSTFLR